MSSRYFVIQHIAYNVYPRIEGGIQSYANPTAVPLERPVFEKFGGGTTADLNEAALYNEARHKQNINWAKAQPKLYAVLEVSLVLKEH